ncbi:Prenyltransferase and squalene oxidase repeat-containing protein [Streptomyces sp. WMMB 714]|uniref:prenyltransferase/squalene oxidase repeat-containing protein n=1 Tax=Streptomyces sp. WMMB 714 TaxID=1286822 RepID=UPI0006963247|nr:prenyltransferase/squalene oxidase repeat-containing protein [Streptomyces sp. WMMB 714]SCK39708.1 Prenyltransferase and squalene oxidase repeat-containing protein [Streptomyces sp. WMMB 714]
MNRASLGRAAALSALAFTAVSATPAYADPPGDTSPPQAAAAWAASKLSKGANASGDHGLTADIVIGLAASGTGGDTANKATDWLAEHAEEYITRGVKGDVSAGAAAKLALVAGVEHRDATAFGDIDLVATLKDRMQDSGRFTDDTASGDMSNQFTQSLAVLALDRADSLPEKAADFLAKSRCEDGGYPLTFKSDPAKCTSDVDSTGLAVQALLAAERKDDAAPALDWLEKRQNKNGGFAYGEPESAANSNTTALAVQALKAGERRQAAAHGVAWLKTMQLGCDAKAADRGAVGYMKPVADGSALRATAQVIPALAGKSLIEVDGADAEPGLSDIVCAPGDGNSGGSDGGSSTGGASGGGSGEGTDGGSGDGGSTAGDSGGSGDSDSGGSANPGADGGGSSAASAGASAGGPGGSLASSGATVLPAAGVSTALLIGGTALVLERRRRRTS